MNFEENRIFFVCVCVYARYISVPVSAQLEIDTILPRKAARSLRFRVCNFDDHEIFPVG